MKRNLGQAATLLTTYIDNLEIAWRILGGDGRKGLRIPTTSDLSLLKIVAKEAQESIGKFEKIIQQLNEEGRFQE